MGLIDLSSVEDVARAGEVLSGAGSGLGGGLGSAVRQAFAGGYDFLVMPDVLDQVVVQEVFKARGGLLGGSRWLGGARWDSKGSRPELARFNSTVGGLLPGLAGHSAVGRTLGGLYRRHVGELPGVFGEQVVRRGGLTYVERPDWPVAPLLVADPTSAGAAFRRGLTGGRAVRWSQPGQVLKRPQVGQVIYAGFMPGGLVDPTRVGASPMWTAGTVKPRFLAGGLPITGVEGNTLFVGNWIDNPDFGGETLLGHRVDAAATVRRQLEAAGYVVVDLPDPGGSETGSFYDAFSAAPPAYSEAGSRRPPMG